MKPKRFRQFVTNNLPTTTFFVATATAVTTAYAADINWDGSDSTAWNDPNNWAEVAVPTTADVAWISNTATNIPSVTTTEAVDNINVAQGTNTSVLNIDNLGTLSADFVDLGNGTNNASTSLGTINVNTGGTFNVEEDLRMAFAGDASSLATLNIDGGTVNVASTVTRWVIMGQWDPGSSEMNITNGGTLQLNAGTDIKLAVQSNQSGNHTINVDGVGSQILGQAGQNSHIELGRAGSGNYTLNVSNGGLVETSAVWTNDGSAASSTINIDGGTLRGLNDDANFVRLNSAGTNSFNVLAGGATINTNGFNLTIGNPVLEGATTGGGLTVTGGGSLTLEGANTYTGATSVDGAELNINLGVTISNTSGVDVAGGGQLTVDDTLPSSVPVTITDGSLDGADGATDGTVTVADLATNTISAGDGGIGTFTFDTLTFQGDATVSLQANGADMDQSLIVNTALTATPASGVVSFDVTNSGGLWIAAPSGHDYLLIDHAGAYAGTPASDFAVGTLTPALASGQTAEIVDDGLGGIVLRVTGDPLLWTGDTDANWDESTVNWEDTGGATVYTPGQSVLFEDGATELNVNLALAVEPGLVQFSNFLDSYTISSTGGFGINGGAAVAIDSGGTVTIETDNAYTGLTSISDGALSLTGTASINDSSSIQLGDDGEIVFAPTGAVEYANPITGTGNITPFVGTEAVTMSGTGTLTLSGANTFTGGFALESGQLNLNSVGALGAGPGVITINGGTIDNTSGGAITMAPAKDMDLNVDLSFIGTNDLHLPPGTMNIFASRTFSVPTGITLGVGGPNDAAAGYDVTKTGDGTLVVNGGNIAGSLDVQSGIVGIREDFLGAAPIDSDGATGGTGIIQNSGLTGSRWTFWSPASDVSSDVLIRNNDGSNIMQLGIVKRGANKLTLTNASNVATASLNVDAGTLELTGGTYGMQNDDGTTRGDLVSIVGFDAADAKLIIAGATVNYNNGGGNPWSSTLDVGQNGSGAGAIELSSGSLTTHKQMAIGRNGGYGGMTQTGGTTSVGGFLAMGLGNGSTGALNLSGGTFSINNDSPATIGASVDANAVINVNGTGIFNHSSDPGQAFWIGEQGSAVVNVSGTGQFNVPNAGIELGRNNVATASGTLNLLGGTVTTQRVYKPGAAATGRLNFNGGTLAANTATALFIDGLSSAYVYHNGGSPNVIDNGGNNITIPQALLAPTGGGVSETGLTPSGGGYIETPVVTVTGDGTGATAVAEIDGSGNLTGVTVTNPGVDYTTATFNLLGGGVSNTGALGGAPTIVANTSGGITFAGAATTTLTGVNRYTGNTTVDTGCSITVALGGEISVAPLADTVSSKITGPGNVTFQGKLRVDATNTDITDGNSWTVVDVASPTYDSTFGVAIAGVLDLTPQGDGVTHIGVDGTNTWTYDETTGVLSLAVSALSGFEGWISGFTVADDTPSGNSDADTLANVGEYWHDNNPEVSEGSAVSVVETGGNLVLTFQRSDLAQSNGDVTGHVEFGSDLAGWTRVAVPAASSVVGGVTFTITDGSPTDTVVASVPITATEFFARLVYVK